MRTETPYVTTLAMAAALALSFLVPVGCGPRETAAPAPPPAVEPSSPPPDATPTPTTEPQQAEPSGRPPAAPTPVVSPPPPAVSPPPPAVSPPPPAVLPPPPASDPLPTPGAGGVVDPGGEIAVKATRPGLTRIGAAKCGLCHKLQYASWSETAHAKREPPLDCESCHGAGSEYKSLKVMKDAEKAEAAGLVPQKATFCATCHRQGWTDDQLQKAHAHKEPPKP